MNERFALLWCVILAAPPIACSERAVDLDAPGPKPVVNVEARKGAGDDVIVVLNEQVMRLEFAGNRLFWYADDGYVACHGTHTMALRSCLVDDCANTLVTYVSSTTSCRAAIEDTAGPSLAGSYSQVEHSTKMDDFATDGVMIHWGPELRSCPVAGCEVEPSVLMPGRRMEQLVSSGRIHWINASNPFGLQRCTTERCAETVETLADFGEPLGASVRGLVLMGGHAYWIQGPETFDIAPSTIRRVATDGQNIVDTVTDTSIEPGGLSVVDGSVYWANGYFPGTITRCPMNGCDGEGPIEVVGGLVYPRWTGVAGSTLLWMGTNDMGIGAELELCAMPNCLETRERLEPAATWILGQAIAGETFYYATSSDEGTTTSIHRRNLLP